MRWNNISRDEKYLILFGSIFLSLIILFIIITFAAKTKPSTSKAYQLADDQIVSIKSESSTTSTTGTTIKRAIAVLCKYAQKNKDCDNLAKFNLVREDCCNLGFCC